MQRGKPTNYLWLIRFIGLLVPRRLRADWWAAGFLVNSCSSLLHEFLREPKGWRNAKPSLP
jgi:hypothetical protein